jgi:uncharacterized membrane protein YebE (DUF533 family)
MTSSRSVKAADILEIAEEQELSRGGLQALIGAAEADGTITSDDALAAMRALLCILELAEGTQ